jgi:hypothetical protein
MSCLFPSHNLPLFDYDDIDIDQPYHQPIQPSIWLNIKNLFRRGGYQTVPSDNYEVETATVYNQSDVNRMNNDGQSPRIGMNSSKSPADQDDLDDSLL